MEDLMKRTVLFFLTAIMLLLPTTAQGADIYRFMGDDNEWHIIVVDSVTGLPSQQCYMSDGSGVSLGSTGDALHVAITAFPAGGIDVNVRDGAGNAIDSRTGALAVVQEDGAGNLVDVATETTLNLTSIDVAGILVDTTSIDGKVATEATAATLGTEVTSAAILVDTTAILADTTAILADTTSIDGKVATEVTLATVETNTDSLVVVGGGAEATALRVTLANDSTGLVSVDDGAGSLTVDGTFWQVTQPVSAAALPLPAGAATNAAQLPDGHNVTVDNAGAGAAVNIQDGGNTITIDGTVAATQSGNWSSRTQDGAGNVIDSQTGALSTALEDGSGNLCDVAGSQYQVTIRDYGQAVVDGEMTGVTALSMYGYNTAVGATWEDVWSDTGVIPQLAAQELHKIKSDDADDDGAPVGNGARTVKVYCVDGAWAQQTETITMNGVAAVTMTQNCLHAWKMEVITVGTSFANEGTITLYKNDGATKMLVMMPYDNESAAARYPVASGENLKIHTIHGSEVAADASKIAVFVQASPTSPYLLAYQRVLKSDSGVVRLESPIEVPAQGIVSIRSQSLGGAGAVSAGFDAWIE